MFYHQHRIPITVTVTWPYVILSYSTRLLKPLTHYCNFGLLFPHFSPLRWIPHSHCDISVIRLWQSLSGSQFLPHVLDSATRWQIITLDTTAQDWKETTPDCSLFPANGQLEKNSEQWQNESYFWNDEFLKNHLNRLISCKWTWTQQSKTQDEQQRSLLQIVLWSSFNLLSLTFCQKSKQNNKTNLVIMDAFGNPSIVLLFIQ